MSDSALTGRSARSCALRARLPIPCMFGNLVCNPQTKGDSRISELFMQKQLFRIRSVANFVNRTQTTFISESQKPQKEKRPRLPETADRERDGNVTNRSKK